MSHPPLDLVKARRPWGRAALPDKRLDLTRRAREPQGVRQRNQRRLHAQRPFAPRTSTVEKNPAGRCRIPKVPFVVPMQGRYGRINQGDRQCV
jgi:hypothetical protein